MCGIAGIFHVDGAVADARLVQSMVNALAHRGPDGQGVWTYGPVGLGHARLAIRGLGQEGQQPMAHPNRKVWVSYNGEIYNDAAIKAELSRDHGAVFHTSCDTEILPHGFSAWGVDLFHRLEGMFAIALWNEAEGALYLARDGIGIKPLYYSYDGRVLRFASEIKALLADPAQKRQFDPAMLHRFFSQGFVGPDAASLLGVAQVPPGHILRVGREGLSFQRFWAPSRRPDIYDMGAALEAFQPLWDRVVQDHLISDVPVGVLQSGGIDSALVSLALRAPQTPLFTATFAAQGFDEKSDADQVGQTIGSRIQGVPIDTHQAWPTVFSAIVHHSDGQIADESCAPLFLLCRAVRDHVTVALTGDGGDEFFGGYTTYKASRLAEQLRPMLPRGLARIMGRLAYGWPNGGSGRFGALMLASRFFSGIGYGGAYAHTRWRQLFPDFMVGDLYGPAMREQIDQNGFAPYEEAMERTGPDATPLDRFMMADQGAYLPGQLLLKSDLMSMASGLELRVPFLDRRVMDFAGRLAPSLLYPDGGESKILLRQAARARGLPAAVASAKKRGFNAPIAQVLRGPLRPTAEHYFTGVGRAAFAPYLSVDRLADLWAEHETGRRDHAYVLWPALVFAEWRIRQSIA